jgi:hypothetical protein
MAARLDQLTLREKLRDSAQLSRELIEHLELGFLPKLVELVEKSPPKTDPQDFVPDITIRNLVAAVLESEQFTARLDENLKQYTDSLMKELRQMSANG